MHVRDWGGSSGCKQWLVFRFEVGAEMLLKVRMKQEAHRLLSK